MADVTITRLAEDCFRLITGAGFIDNDRGYIISRLQPEDAPVEIRDVTENYACIGLWGPKAPDVLAAVTDDDISAEALPYMQAKSITINGVPVLAQRISYVGEAGWELYADSNKAIIVWDHLWDAGQAHDIIAAGYKVLGSLRIEKGYLYYDNDITPLDNPFEAGLGFTVDFENGGDFIGRQSLQKIKNEGVPNKMCTIIIGDEDWLPLYGGEAVVSGGKAITRLRSTGYGYTVKKNIGLAYLPLELAPHGTPLEIEIFGELVPARVSERILHDPAGSRMK